MVPTERKMYGNEWTKVYIDEGVGSSSYAIVND